MSFSSESQERLGPYFDLFEGDQHAVIRIRQLKTYAEDEKVADFRPFILVNLVSCLEWYARSKIKQLIDFHSDNINLSARILREAKINYPALIQSQRQNFSIGDLIAISRNFSAIEDIEETIDELVVRSNTKYVALFQKYAGSMRMRPKYIREKLAKLFKRRHEIVHGTPRNFVYQDRSSSLVSARELQVYIGCSLEFVGLYERFLRSAIKEYRERSNIDLKMNLGDRLLKAEDRLSDLALSIEKRISNEDIATFREAQRAWFAWRDAEAELQTIDWAGGTGRAAVHMGVSTSLTMQRIR